MKIEEKKTSSLNQTEYPHCVTRWLFDDGNGELVYSVVRVKAQETDDVMVPRRFNATGSAAQEQFDLHLEGMDRLIDLELYIRLKLVARTKIRHVFFEDRTSMLPRYEPGRIECLYYSPQVVPVFCKEINK